MTLTEEAATMTFVPLTWLALTLACAPPGDINRSRRANPGDSSCRRRATRSSIRRFAPWY